MTATPTTSSENSGMPTPLGIGLAGGSAQGGGPSRSTIRLRAAGPWVSLVITRLIQLVVVFLLVSLATLGMIQLLPGGPAVAILGQTATPDQIKVLNAELGLNKTFF